jgi:glycosyltransferase involved in cell wall biosynthesis
MAIRLLYTAPDPALTLDQQGGAGTHMRGTIEALRREGIEVQAAVGSPSGGWRPSNVQRPAPRLRRSVPPAARLLARDLRTLAHGRAFAKGEFEPFDVVYERSCYLLDNGRRLAAGAGVPYVVETDGILVAARRAAYGAPLRGWAERLERSKIHSADLVTVTSEASRNEVAARYGVPAERLLLKGLGVERGLLAGAAPGEPTIEVGWAGTFQPYHRVELLLEAVRRLGTSSAVLAGDGPGLASARAEAAGLPVELTGLLPRGQALERLAACRVLVIPESAESVYPVKLLEYAALRRPVVCPRRPAFDEFRSDGGELLFRFEPGDPEDLARAIAEAASSPGDRAERLHAFVLDGYTWDAVGARLAAGIRALT